MAAIYSVYTSPNHPPIPDHLPTLIVTPHGQPSNILYSYLHTNFNTENYLLTPSPQGDLCVAKLCPPRANPGKASSSDPGHSSASSTRIVRCEASRNLKWTIANTGVISPIYKLSLPSPDSPDLPLFQVSKPNPNATFWSMFYFAYAGHDIPPERIEFGKIQKNPPGPNGGGTRISITGKTPEEKAVWQTLGEGNEDCVEWVVLCAALNLLDDEILKAAEKNPPPGAAGRPTPVALRDPGATPSPGPVPNARPARSATLPPQQQQQVPQRPVPTQSYPAPGPVRQGPVGYQQPPRGHPHGPSQLPPGHGLPPAGYPPPQGYNPNQRIPPPQMRFDSPVSGQAPLGYAARPPPPMQVPPPNPGQAQPGLNQTRRF